MRFNIDSDLHIHSKISPCSKDPKQSVNEILEYAKKTGLKTICLTNHFWDSDVKECPDWYVGLDYDYICSEKPLISTDEIDFLFGCETELDKNSKLGIDKAKFDLFDFIVIPTTHFNLVGSAISENQVKTVETLAKAWVSRLEAVLDMDLPFHKVGIAHLTCTSIARQREEYLAVLDSIPTKEMERLFTKAARLGVGIELNSRNIKCNKDEEQTVLRVYKVAKECGCKFYCGSDSHHPQDFENVREVWQNVIDLLGLCEEDKFVIKG